MSDVPEPIKQSRVRFLADGKPRLCHCARPAASATSGRYPDCPPAGILGFPDPAVLAFAAQQGRILITHDKRTIPDHFAAFLAEGNQSPGVMLISRKVSIGQAIEALLLVWEASSHEEWHNLLTRLPL